ncbi:hypothetical protein RIR_e20509_A0A2N0Q2K8_9GLOM [Rhizophagus irregularis DAOM 181602=DAOM 197198]|uniref:Uncharacterized protein n=1 Tax=Rhizophagus irregularis (strain DAOM 181602 / DAOM 197198 / MUCL 43194) TaxID=747089 RepID=U9U4R8_RHIID|nr:hypothetical protein RIR_e20509_A0A2N0Q2K8_9GLOM [Rhizophagus irregularis DAOM 181602=DAOM 197198]
MRFSYLNVSKIEILYYDHMKVEYSEFQKYIILMHHFIMFLCFLEVKMELIVLPRFEN